MVAVDLNSSIAPRCHSLLVVGFFFSLEHDCNVGKARTLVKTFVLEQLNYMIIDPCHLLSAVRYFPFI
jgi:hypothetical protein